MNKITLIAALAAASTFANAGAIADKLIGGDGPRLFVTASPKVVNFALCDNVGIRTFSGPCAVSVGNFAFRGCQNLSSVDLGAVKDMSKAVGVFSGCFSLTNVVLKSMTFNGISKDSSFPWHAPNQNVHFVFKNGTFDRFGKRID